MLNMSTAKFDPNAFSAVAAFFGKNDEDHNNVESKTDDENKNEFSSKRSRSGVGVSSKHHNMKNKTSPLENNTRAKDQILKIGRNKRKKQYEEEEEEDEMFHDDTKQQQDDESDEEDEGRTSAIKEKKKVLPSSNINKEIDLVVDKNAKKKKKKASKKERLAKKKESEDIDSQNPTMMAEADDTHPETQDPTNDFGTENKDNDNDNRISNIVSKPKKKRIKVRSKQKNIRKDNRSFTKKPDHLKLGNSDYAGRPMTMETRNYLNLGESKTRQKLKEQMKKNNIDNKNDNMDSFENGNETAVASESEQLSSSLMIENLGVDIGITNGNESSQDFELSHQIKSSKKKKKRKRSKYKNL